MFARPIGSIVVLGGNLTSTGANTFNDTRPAGVVGPKAQVDLSADVRTFNVQSSLDIGSTTLPIILINES